MADQPMPYPLLSGANPEQRPPLRRSRLALSSLVLGVLSIPLALTVYLGVLTGLIAVGCATAGLVATRRGRAGGRAMAAGGLVAGLVGLIIGGSLFAWGIRTVHACQDRIGHRPSVSELKACIRDGV